MQEKRNQQPTILEKELTFPDFKTYHKATVTGTVCYRNKDSCTPLGIQKLPDVHIGNDFV